MKKVGTPKIGLPTGPKKAFTSAALVPPTPATIGGKPPSSNDSPTSRAKATASQKTKSNKRVKWADHFGNPLERSKEIESRAASGDDGNMEERRKRDRLREKELLANAKRSKLTDDDDDDDLYGLMTPKMSPQMQWHTPLPLAARADVAAVQLESKELETQASRMSSVASVRYTCEADVPPNPAPMSEVEEALDMASQESAIVAVIPYGGVWRFGG